MQKDNMIKKRTGEIIVTNQKQNKLLRKLYNTWYGRCLVKLLAHPLLSKAAGVYMDSFLSKPLIKPFIRNSGIDTSQYIMQDFRSYNQFFTRRIKPEKRPIDYAPDHLISPCDSKLSVYCINSESVFRIKNSHYRVSDLLDNALLARHFEGGYCFIFRLEVDDYHRYCYIDNGTHTVSTHIKGEIHTVNPIAMERYNIYKRNTREYTILHTENFGDVAQIEVGAMLVGRICNNFGSHVFVRGEEKGRFEFGGSTIVLLFERETVVPSPDLLKNTADGYETVVKLGEQVGVSAK